MDGHSRFGDARLRINRANLRWNLAGGVPALDRAVRASTKTLSRRWDLSCCAAAHLRHIARYRDVLETAEAGGAAERQVVQLGPRPDCRPASDWTFKVPL